MNSQILYFKETSPLREQIFNNYMNEAVMLYNEEFKGEAINAWDGQEGFTGFYPVFLIGHIATRWKEMVRDN